MIWGLLDALPSHLHFLGEDPGLRALSAEEERGPGEPWVGCGHHGWAEGAGGQCQPLIESFPIPAALQPCLTPNPGTQNEGHGFHTSGGMLTLGAQQVLRRAREGSGTGCPPPSGRLVSTEGPPLLAPTEQDST